MLSKIKNRSEFRVSVRIHSVLGCVGSCGNMSRKKHLKKVTVTSLSELIMALKSANRCSSLRTMPIIDDDIVRMCPSDLIGCHNRGTNGVRLGQLVIREPISH